jgi:hypothetical protein
MQESSSVKKTVLIDTLIVAALVAASPSFAAPKPNGGKAASHCFEIAKICKAAGFVKGDWKKGNGVWRDCIDPIVQGQTAVPGATKSLPSVDPKIVEACKAERPKFGMGKVGSK